ncbi:MAG: hypothetical protein FJ286_15285 [Planctomycetes bacterium]|nr:hypothetical protein [Planctomycetota bacterium]
MFPYALPTRFQFRLNQDRLEFEDHVVEMGPGDWLDIPAHHKHRVAWTSPNEPTVWLAVHYSKPA